jgi:hypothetical protein
LVGRATARSQLVTFFSDFDGRFTAMWRQQDLTLREASFASTGSKDEETK